MSATGLESAGPGGCGVVSPPDTRLSPEIEPTSGASELRSRVITAKNIARQHPANTGTEPTTCTPTGVCQA